jgi:hypothetical protein
MTYVVRGFRRGAGGALARAELITSSKEDADEMSASLKRLGFSVSFHFFSEEEPDDVRALILMKAADAAGEEFFKGTLLNLRA